MQYLHFPSSQFIPKEYDTERKGDGYLGAELSLHVLMSYLQSSRFFLFVFLQIMSSRIRDPIL